MALGAAAAAAAVDAFWGEYRFFNRLASSNAAAFFLAGAGVAGGAATGAGEGVIGLGTSSTSLSSESELIRMSAMLPAIVPSFFCLFVNSYKL